MLLFDIHTVDSLAFLITRRSRYGTIRISIILFDDQSALSRRILLSWGSVPQLDVFGLDLGIPR